MKIAKDFVKDTLVSSMGLAQEMKDLSEKLKKKRKSCEVQNHEIKLFGKRTNLVGHAVRGAINL